MLSIEDIVEGETWEGIDDYDPPTPLTIDDFDEDWLKDELEDEDVCGGCGCNND